MFMERVCWSSAV